jgi:hypothetical protein
MDAKIGTQIQDKNQNALNVIIPIKKLVSEPMIIQDIIPNNVDTIDTANGRRALLKIKG